MALQDIINTYWSDLVTKAQTDLKNKWITSSDNLTSADMNEFKDTWSFSNSTYDKLKPQVITTPVTWSESLKIESPTSIDPKTSVFNEVTANTWVANAIKTEAEAQQNIYDKTITTQTERKDEINKQLELDKKAAEDLAIKEQAIIDKQNADKAAVEKEQQQLIDKAKQDELDYIEKSKNASLSALKAEQELQRVKDEAAIKEAAAKQEVASQQANWAFNKMWLTFSSSAVLQTQSIATQWATAIAQLKVQANYNQAQIAARAAEVELWYTKEVNKVINDATDRSLTLKNNTITRIWEYQNNLLLTEKEKKTSIDNLLKAYKTEKWALEDYTTKLMKEKSDDAITKAEKLQATLKVEENSQRDKISTLMNTWAWYWLTTSQQNDMMKKAWMNSNEINTANNNYIATESYKMMNKVIWDDFVPSQVEMEAIVNDTNNLLRVGKSMVEAITIATSKIIQNSAKYKLAQQVKEKALKDSMKDKAKAVAKAPAWPKASDFNIINTKDWLIRINKITWDITPITKSDASAYFEQWDINPNPKKEDETLADLLENL